MQEYELDKTYKLSNEAIKRFFSGVTGGLNYCLAREIGTRPWKPATIDSNGCVKNIKMVDTGHIISVRELNCKDIKSQKNSYVDSYVMFTRAELGTGSIHEYKEPKDV